MPETPEFRIEKSPDGTWVGDYAGHVLRTAFQPIFRFEKGRLAPIACEALLRVSRDGNPVLTDTFFTSLDKPAFEALEPQLRSLHIRNACHIPSSERRLFLNFDPRIPEHPARFEAALRTLGAELRTAGISPADVVCEITEAETQNNAALTHFAYELRARGYMLAVDDFGTRASRQQRIAAIAPDIVKFDGRMVKRLLSNPAGAATLRMMVSEFHKQGIHSVLEGLEALWEIGPAESTGAPMVQGYALAAPRIVSTDFSNWIAQFRPQPEAPAVQMVKTFR